MIRQLYSVLLVTAVVAALAAYTHPHQASRWVSAAAVRTGDILGRLSVGLAAAAEQAQDRAGTDNGLAPSSAAIVGATDRDGGWTYATDQGPSTPAGHKTPFRLWWRRHRSAAAPPPADHASTGPQATAKPAAGRPQQLPAIMPGALGLPRQDGTTDPSWRLPLETARYPRADWAGDWQGYGKIPADVRAAANPVRPVSATQPVVPQVAATMAEVNRYLPSQATPAAGPMVSSAVDPLPQVDPGATRALPGQTVYPSTPSRRGPTEGSPSPQMRYPSTAPAASHRLPPVSTASAVFPTPPPRPVAQPPAPASAEMRVDNPVANCTLCENAQIIARVGSEIVLGSEIYPAVDEVLQSYRDKLSDRELKIQRKRLMQQILQQRVEMKLLYADAKRALPAEALKTIGEQLAEQFENKEVPKRIKLAKVGSRREFEEKLALLGTSLDQEKRGFTERAIAQQWVHQQLQQDPEVTHDELVAYYHEHGADFDHSARAKWEQLTVKFSRHPDRAEAQRLIAEMGNEVIRGGSLAEVARRRSEGSTASHGGQWDWTTRGSLKSDVLDKAIFALPLGRLSQILEDEQGFHIIRVIEREEAHRTPFVEAQVEIKEKIKNQHRREQLSKLVERLRKEIPVWTIFDDQTAEAGAASHRTLR